MTMEQLVVFHKNKRIFQVSLNKDRFIIGRSSESDLILTGPEISRSHLVLQKTDKGYEATDTSSHGSYIDQQALKSAKLLTPGTCIVISDWRLVYEETTTQNPISDQHQTQITKMTQNRSGDETVLLNWSPNAKSAVLSKITLIVQTRAGTLQPVTLRKKQMTIGSSKDCDIVIADPFVSKQHAEIFLSDQGVQIKDSGSRNGLILNNSKVTNAIIQKNSIVQLGESSLQIIFEEIKNPNILLNNNETFFCGLVGRSDSMKALFRNIALVAQTDMTVLIHGESGTGKELVAKAIHDLSPRSQKPYVVVNCAAIAKELIESELFGHEKGAFTGADEKHIGAFEQANGGTLFLDEIGELSSDLQAKILRVLEYQMLRPVGAKKEIKIDFRLIAATHRDLAKMVKAGEFREDLFYRLYVLPLNLPALRDRENDIALLAEHFLQQLSDGQKSFSPQALQKICDHDWPGNVRELRNTIMRALVFTEGPIVEEDAIDWIDLSKNKSKLAHGRAFQSSVPSHLSKTELIKMERESIIKTLVECKNDKNLAAEQLGIGRSTLFRKIKELKIDLPPSED
ncbi:MAG: sigma 54-interacting transcriptional regulator [Deltaproteobacteria bacterium]|nr:sigma 54-interacting transcriptional regulator [Deltaproteobacteria bacterium]